MDYAFGEQAYETMEELLKPYFKDEQKSYMPVESISIMGKAGILNGVKGDIMIPDAHLFEGTADNYPFENELSVKDLEGYDLDVYSGAMMSVLGNIIAKSGYSAFLSSFQLECNWSGNGRRALPESNTSIR